MLPSERFDDELGRCRRVGSNALRRTLGIQTGLWLPSWSGRSTPHVLRHYCASSLYKAGMDLKALQELLGHQWLATTSGYIHVRSEHVEQAWKNANQSLSLAARELVRRTAPFGPPDQHCLGWSSPIARPAETVLG